MAVQPSNASDQDPGTPEISLRPIRFRDEKTADEYLNGLTAGGRYILLDYTMEDVGGKKPYKVTARRRLAQPPTSPPSS